MKKEEMTVSDLIKCIESGGGEDIRLYSFQVARMFGVYEQTIARNVKTIIQSGLIIPPIGCEFRQMGNMLVPDTHNLEMIISLAFRIQSSEAAKLREWVIGKLIYRAEKEMIILSMNNSVILN